MQRLLYRVKRTWWKLVLTPYLGATGLELGDKVEIQGRPIVSLAKGSRIKIGARCVLCSDSQATALGVNHPVVLRAMRPGAELIIGEDTGISGASICAAVSVKIGAGCLLGANVTIADTDFHVLASEWRRYNTNPAEIACAPVVIEDNVFLGAGVFVLKGVTVGRDSVIGAGSLVTHNIPAGSVAVGNPARVIRQLSS